MSWTKGQLVDEAYQELALAGGTGFDLDGEELARGLRRLDVLLATWAAKGVRIGYAFPAGANKSNLDDDSGIPDSAVETVFLNLALRLSAGLGKQLSQETIAAARAGYDTLLWLAAQPIEQQMPNTMPRGAGNKPWRLQNRNFMPRPDMSPLQLDTENQELNILPS